MKIGLTAGNPLRHAWDQTYTAPAATAQQQGFAAPQGQVNK